MSSTRAQRKATSLLQCARTRRLSYEFIFSPPFYSIEMPSTRAPSEATLLLQCARTRRPLHELNRNVELLQCACTRFSNYPFIYSWFSCHHVHFRGRWTEPAVVVPPASYTDSPVERTHLHGSFVGVRTAVGYKTCRAAATRRSLCRFERSAEDSSFVEGGLAKRRCRLLATGRAPAVARTTCRCSFLPWKRHRRGSGLSERATCNRAVAGAAPKPRHVLRPGCGRSRHAPSGR